MKALCKRPQSLLVHVCINPVNIQGTVFLVSSILSNSYTLSTFSCAGFPEPEGMDLMKTCLLALHVPKSLTFCIMSGYDMGLCICFQLMQKEASLMMTKQGTEV